MSAARPPADRGSIAASDGRAPDLSEMAVHEMAADWFLRRDTAGWTGADERAMNAWLDAAASHREAFAAVARTSRALQDLPLRRPRPSAAAHAQPGAAASAPRGRVPAAARRRRVLAPLLLTGLVLLSGGHAWRQWDRSHYGLSVQTAPGETRRVDLPDGSRVTLNFGSRLQVQFDRQHRAVQLDRGEAFFEVAADAARPFTVDSGPSQVKVVGTAFNVRAAPAQTVLKVLQGRVEVRPQRDDPKRVLTMGPGTGLAIDMPGGRYRGIAAAPDSVGDWRSGQLQFRRTPLSEVAEELARYLGQPVTLASPDLGALPVSGVASTSQPLAFLQALPDFLPLRVRQGPDGSWQITRA
ncbi:MAG TPA: FecR domain-containing protein [Pseudorhodoferax sp.]|jgi:transmembrane sensor|nr:FecR domain-containing protein [Pseudorhodoferax sp.]